MSMGWTSLGDWVPTADKCILEGDEGEGEGGKGPRTFCRKWLLTPRIDMSSGALVRVSANG